MPAQTYTLSLHDALPIYEPYMLARNLPGVIVLVDKNRVKAGAFAIKKFGCDTLVLDDGFQYLPLKGRLNLLLVDKTNPFRSEEHTSELQSPMYLVCRLLL